MPLRNANSFVALLPLYIPSYASILVALIGSRASRRSAQLDRATRRYATAEGRERAEKRTLPRPKFGESFVARMGEGVLCAQRAVKSCILTRESLALLGGLSLPYQLGEFQHFAIGFLLMLERNFNLRAARLEWQKQKKVARSTRGLVFLPRMALKANYAIAEQTEQNRKTTDSL